ncbi:MAG: Rab family GTPase [Promethearchaeota archaeon]
MYDAIFKIVIFGDSGSGKTTLRKRLLTNNFISSSQHTIGVDFETKVLNVYGKEVKLLIWDFAGEERFRFMFPQYIYGAMGGLLMYDITNYSSFSHIADWLSVINGSREKFPVILMGGKLDLEDYREISYSEGLETARSMNLKGFVECSSKTGENVKESFEELSKMMLNKMEIKSISTQNNNRELIEEFEKKFC